MLNEITKTNNKETDKKKILILKRYNLSMDKKGKIIEQIKKFNKSKKILELNSKIKLGKLEVLKGPRFDENKKIIPYSYVGIDRYFINQRREALKNVTHIYKFDRGHKKLDKSNKEIISYKSDSNIYSKFTKTFSKFLPNNNINNEEKNINPIPKLLKKNLKKQERIFERLGIFENIEENIEKRLLKKTKKNKKHLLLKLSDTCNTMRENIKTDEVNSNLTNWNFKLRNPKINGLYARKGYFKATSLNEDLFSIINLNKEKEIFLNPFKKYCGFNKKKLLNKKIFQKEYLTSLKIKGINFVEKAILNKKNKNKINKNNSYEKFIKNFSFNEQKENTDKNLSENYIDKIFALDYKFNHKYDKSRNLYKFHN